MIGVNTVCGRKVALLRKLGVMLTSVLSSVIVKKVRLRLLLETNAEDRSYICDV